MIYFLPKYSRGIFNRYRKGMPISEMMLKDLVALWRALRFRGNGTILVYPHFPSTGSTIFRIAKHLNLYLTNRIEGSYDRAIYWEYNTVRVEFNKLEMIEGLSVINLNCRDISKDFVDEAMHHAFGYSTRIDPAKHNGIAVRKSLKNAVHDGMMVECPCLPDQGFIYQKLIDSSVNEHEVMDIRIPVMRGLIPHVYLNYRPNNERFKNVPNRAELCEDVHCMLSSEEQRMILNFCKLIHMEYGELDTLRDVHDGRLYIVDANNTPQGPPKNLSKKEKHRAIQLMSAAFKSQF